MANETGGMEHVLSDFGVMLPSGGVLLAISVTALGFMRWLLGLAGARQDKRIAQLEHERSDDRKLIMAITQALFEVMNVVERHEPDAPALERARSVLKKAFPADAPDHPDT
jgi:hypothetical protein